MSIQNQPLFLSISVPIQLSSPVKDRIRIMNDTVVIWTDYYKVAGIVIQALYKMIYMVCLCHVRTEFFSNQLTAKLAAVNSTDSAM